LQSFIERPKQDASAEAVTVGYSAVRVLADASEITGLPRDNFEVWEISKTEFDDSGPTDDAGDAAAYWAMIPERT
jgi:hypothetical protein